MKVLGKQDLEKLKGRDISVEDVPVPEEGENAVVRVREMPSEAYAQFEQFWFKHGGKGDNQPPPKDFRFHLLRLTVVDENGEPLFASDKEAKETISALNGNAWQRVLQKALDLNGLTKEAAETARKNS